MSGEDITLQLVKFGACRVLLSHRQKPRGCDWPNNVQEVPEVSKLDGQLVEFVNGYKMKVIVILFKNFKRNNIDQLFS